MKKILIMAFLLMFLSAGALSLSINSPEKIEDKAVLFFNVSLDKTDSFDETKIYIDDELVLTVTSNQFVQKLSPFVLNAFTYDHDHASTGGLKLYVLYGGLGKGTHAIKALSFENGNSQGDDLSTVNVYIPLAESYRIEVDSELKSIKSKNEYLETSLNTSITEINKIYSDQQEFQQTLANLSGKEFLEKNDLDELSSQFNNLTQRVNLEMAQLLEVQNSLDTLETEVDKKADNLLSGFFSASDTASEEQIVAETATNPLLILLPIGLIAMLVAGFVLFQNKDKVMEMVQGLKNPDEEYALFPKKDEEKDGEYELEFDDEEQPQVKKWGYKGEGTLPTRTADDDEEDDEGEFTLTKLLKY